VDNASFSDGKVQLLKRLPFTLNTLCLELS
jgi:hypothetical protein